MKKSEKRWTSTNPLIDDDGYEDAVHKPVAEGRFGGNRPADAPDRGPFEALRDAPCTHNGCSWSKVHWASECGSPIAGDPGYELRKAGVNWAEVDTREIKANWPPPEVPDPERLQELAGIPKHENLPAVLQITGFDDIDRFLADTFEVMRKKGHDYRQGNDSDILHNFRTVADTVGTDMEKVWFTYFYKHFAAMATFIKEGGQSESEPIEGRITDQIVYLVLFWKMVQERKEAEYNRAATEHGIIT